MTMLIKETIQKAKQLLEEKIAVRKELWEDKEDLVGHYVITLKQSPYDVIETLETCLQRTLSEENKTELNKLFQFENDHYDVNIDYVFQLIDNEARQISNFVSNLIEDIKEGRDNLLETLYRSSDTKELTGDVITSNDFNNDPILKDKELRKMFMLNAISNKNVISNPLLISLLKRELETNDYDEIGKIASTVLAMKDPNYLFSKINKTNDSMMNVFFSSMGGIDPVMYAMLKK